MQISEETNIEMETPVRDDMEFVTLDTGQEEPAAEAPADDKVTMTREEFSALKAGQDSTTTLSQSFGKLAERLGQPRAPEVANVAAPVQSTDEELENEIFTPGKTMATIRKILAAEGAPSQGQSIQALMQTNRKLLELDPATKDLYGKYKAEVEAKVQSIPPQYRFQPDIYEKAYHEVLKERQSEIVESRAQELADKAVAAALAKYGITAGSKLPGKPALQQEAGPGGAARPTPSKTTVYMTQDDVRDMRDRGLDPDDVDQKRYYWENVKKGKGGK